MVSASDRRMSRNEGTRELENNYVLALDISGFCTGYAIWSLSSDTLSTAGYIPLKDKKDINSKVDKIVSSLETFQENTETISDVFIEDILTKFIAGKSSIKTIISLASINAVVLYDNRKSP